MGRYYYFFLLKKGLSLLFTVQIGALVHKTMKCVWSEETGYALRRDLQRPIPPVTAAIPLTRRPFQRGDARHFAVPPGLWRRITRTRIDQVSRTELINADVPLATVLVAPDGAPCFIAWQIASSEGGKAALYRKVHHLKLSDDEVLLEGVFVPERYRKKKIMACGNWHSAEVARALGGRWAVCYVEARNLFSLRGFLTADFHPYLLTKVVWRAFRRVVSVVSLSEEEALRLETSWRQQPGKSTPV